MDETAVRTGGFGLSAFCLGVAVQLFAAPQRIYERIFDLFGAGAVIAVVAYAVLLAIGPKRTTLGRVAASVVLTLFPLMVWFHELPNSWHALAPVGLVVLIFSVVLVGYWLERLTVGVPPPGPPGTAPTGFPAQAVGWFVVTLLYMALAVFGVAGIQDQWLKATIFVFATLGILGVIATMRLRLDAPRGPD